MREMFISVGIQKMTNGEGKKNKRKGEENELRNKVKNYFKDRLTARGTPGCVRMFLS